MRYLTGRWDPLLLRPGEPQFPAGLQDAGALSPCPLLPQALPLLPYNRVPYDEALYRNVRARRA